MFIRAEKNFRKSKKPSDKHSKRAVLLLSSALHIYKYPAMFHT